MYFFGQCGSYSRYCKGNIWRLPGPRSRHLSTMPRSDHNHWLIKSVTSVLKPEFMTQYTEDISMDVAGSLPFSGPLQLPTKMQCLKLFWYIRDSIGRHNSCSLTNGQIQGKGTFPVIGFIDEKIM